MWQWWHKHFPPPSHFTKEEALQIAHKYELDEEVLAAMEYGFTPDEALEEWDIYPFRN